ncbi:MAG: hypothetical protein L3J39_11390 [Verrucomicrobiales bacterium]|nr:hypothetical protein [Verrucomicrobiales bacterium]
MKKFLFILIVLVVAGGWYFYDPYLKPYIGDYVEKAQKIADEAKGDNFSEEKSKVAKKTPSAVKPAAKTTQKKKADQPAAKMPAKSKPAPMTDLDKLVAERYPMPDIKPLVEIVDHWRRVPAKAYPKQVIITERVAFQLIVEGKAVGASVAVPGTAVAPLRLNGETLQVASLANRTMKSQLPVDQTNFKELVKQRYDQFVVKIRNQVNSNRAKAKKKLAANPEIYKNFGKAEAGWDDPNDARFELVKASLAKGDVKAVQLSEAKQFRWNGSEKINGDLYRGTYDTVSVKFEVKTIFGVFPNEFKCLLQAGRVVGWIDPLTLEEKI